MRNSLLGAVAVAALMLPGAALAQSGTIKIGVLVALEGAFAAGGQDGVRNVELALKQVNNTVAGKKIEIVVAPTDTKPDTTVRMARKLVEQDKVDFIIGPLSGSEGIAMRDFAKTIPDKVVINGISGALETTWVEPARNFYRFNLDGSQWGYGLGSYVVKTKGWKKVATIAADYSFGYTNFMGFAADYCKAGGDIVQRFWQPLGQADFAAIIAQLPENVDAIYLGLGGTDAINFLNQYQQAGEKLRLIGGTIMADQTVLTAKGKAKDALKGTPTSGPFAIDDPSPAWTAYVKLYQDSIPAAQRFPTPSLFGLGYYVATQAAIKGLEGAGGDLSGGQAKFMAALDKLQLDSPVGKITLNENRQATGTVFITEVVDGPDGNLTSKMVGRADNVTQTLGMTAEQFKALGLPSRDVVNCAKLRTGG
ncbi:ABC transporter substrate-binding protein [Prosthecodimorpha staleyi]|uniref:ABC transporter substrate-binding protein n=1 Tax=Prosthecodimorpha staleyi TaxID=2840188 RepID=A0A947DCU3_9HYPH|nr:ABC transporter substrate-binding protein [Prosthecodimorpha staleyi]MBT9292679.1 ABC transporter substrate-binding protein [Prosthecodimorpha staleyi]